MKKILITGSTGFIGSHLTEHCVKEGYRVKALVHYNSMNLWGWLERSKYKKDLEIYSGDVHNFDSVFRAMKGCDAVFHLAALIGIPYSYVSPLAYIKTNIEGTYNILQAARELELKNILITSTSEIYGTAQYVPIDEKHLSVGQSPYSASKIAADQLGISFHKSFGLPVKIVRPFNVYGPRQSARAIVPTIITQLLSGRKNIDLGNLSPTRDLTYVKDTVRAFMAIAACEKFTGEAVNVGMNTETSVGELAKTIAALMKKKIIIKKDAARVRPDNSEVERLCCDNTKITTFTGWKPRYTLEDGLKETTAWFKKNLKSYKADIYNV